MNPQRLDVRFAISWEGAWHVGSGLGTATVDRLLRRRACGPRGEPLPFVPGSQIKGVLRHQCERLFALFSGTVVSPHLLGSEPNREFLDNFRPLAQSKLLVDRLFGTRFQGECLFVDDALSSASNPRPSRLHSRTAIDRVTGTARDRSLFVTEIAAEGSPQLIGRIRARHPAKVLSQDGNGFPLEYSLLLAGLLGIEALGGDRSTGLGGCRIAVPGETVRWNDCEQYPLADALQSFTENDWLEWVKLVRSTLAEGQK